MYWQKNSTYLTFDTIIVESMEVSKWFMSDTGNLQAKLHFAGLFLSLELTAEVTADANFGRNFSVWWHRVALMGVCKSFHEETGKLRWSLCDDAKLYDLENFKRNRRRAHELAQT